MSDNVNTALLEQAAEAIDACEGYERYFESKLPQKLITQWRVEVEKDLASNDLERLQYTSLPALRNYLNQAEELFIEQEVINA